MTPIIIYYGLCTSSSQFEGPTYCRIPRTWKISWWLITVRVQIKKDIFGPTDTTAITPTQENIVFTHLKNPKYHALIIIILKLF